MKILIVDDEKDIVDLVAYNLEKEGHEVLKAYDGERAIQSIRSKGPDLVILDLMLPGIQGLEVCKRLRQDPSTAVIPIIMLTAKGDEIDKVLGLEVGADDYITKPFSLKELMARVKAPLRRAGPVRSSLTGKVRLTGSADGDSRAMRPSMGAASPSTATATRSPGRRSLKTSSGTWVSACSLSVVSTTSTGWPGVAMSPTSASLRVTVPAMGEVTEA